MFIIKLAIRVIRAIRGQKRIFMGDETVQNPTVYVIAGPMGPEKPLRQRIPAGLCALPSIPERGPHCCGAVAICSGNTECESRAFASHKDQGTYRSEGRLRV